MDISDYKHLRSRIEELEKVIKICNMAYIVTSSQLKDYEIERAIAGKELDKLILRVKNNGPVGAFLFFGDDTRAELKAKIDTITNRIDLYNLITGKGE